MGAELLSRVSQTRKTKLNYEPRLKWIFDRNKKIMEAKELLKKMK